jgi:hypothetical protein
MLKCPYCQFNQMTQQNECMLTGKSTCGQNICDNDYDYCPEYQLAGGAEGKETPLEKISKSEYQKGKDVLNK